MGCYCGSKLLHTKCVYTGLDVALCPIFIGYVGYFQFSETCFQFSPKCKSQNLCSCGSSLLVLKPGHLSAEKWYFQAEEVKEFGIARSATGNTDIAARPRFCCLGMPAGRGGRAVRRRPERGCAEHPGALSCESWTSPGAPARPGSALRAWGSTGGPSWVLWALRGSRVWKKPCFFMGSATQGARFKVIWFRREGRVYLLGVIRQKTKPRGKVVAPVGRHAWCTASTMHGLGCAGTESVCSVLRE